MCPVYFQSGFLQGFVHTLPPKKKKLSPGKKQSPVLWLQLIANLTFASEGQQMVMKIPGEVQLGLISLHGVSP